MCDALKYSILQCYMALLCPPLVLLFKALGVCLLVVMPKFSLSVRSFLGFPWGRKICLDTSSLVKFWFIHKWALLLD